MTRADKVEIRILKTALHSAEHKLELKENTIAELREAKVEGLKIIEELEMDNAVLYAKSREQKCQNNWLKVICLTLAVTTTVLAYILWSLV